MSLFKTDGKISADFTVLQSRHDLHKIITTEDGKILSRFSLIPKCQLNYISQDAFYPSSITRYYLAL